VRERLPQFLDQGIVAAFDAPQPVLGARCGFRDSGHGQ
jgi:hypothetical protein